jgi:hypothetical protein
MMMRSVVRAPKTIAGEDVAPVLVGAEKMLPRGRLQAGGHVLRNRVVARQERRADRGDDEDEDNAEADKAERMLAEALPSGVEQPDARLQAPVRVRVAEPSA